MVPSWAETRLINMNINDEIANYLSYIDLKEKHQNRIQKYPL